MLHPQTNGITFRLWLSPSSKGSKTKNKKTKKYRKAKQTCMFHDILTPKNTHSVCVQIITIWKYIHLLYWIIWKKFKYVLSLSLNLKHNHQHCLWCSIPKFTNQKCCKLLWPEVVTVVFGVHCVIDGQNYCPNAVWQSKIDYWRFKS